MLIRKTTIALSVSLLCLSAVAQTSTNATGQLIPAEEWRPVQGSINSGSVGSVGNQGNASTNTGVVNYGRVPTTNGNTGVVPPRTSGTGQVSIPRVGTMPMPAPCDLPGAQQVNGGCVIFVPMPPVNPSQDVYCQGTSCGVLNGSVSSLPAPVSTVNNASLYQSSPVRPTMAQLAEMARNAPPTQVTPEQRAAAQAFVANINAARDARNGNQPSVPTNTGIVPPSTTSTGVVTPSVPVAGNLVNNALPGTRPQPSVPTNTGVVTPSVSVSGNLVNNALPGSIRPVTALPVATGVVRTDVVQQVGSNGVVSPNNQVVQQVVRNVATGATSVVPVTVSGAQTSQPVATTQVQQVVRNPSTGASSVITVSVPVQPIRSQIIEQPISLPVQPQAEYLGTTGQGGIKTASQTK